METAMYVLLGLSCAALILLVLLQQGKGAGVGFSMGGASQAMFGGSGGRDFFIKLTAGVALAFMVACMILGKMSSNTGGQYEGAMKDAPLPVAPASPVLPSSAAPAAGAAAPASAAPVAPAAAARPVGPAPAAQPK
jgi:preprotein translocase subunit SecG